MAALTVDGDGELAIAEDDTRVSGVRCINPDGDHTLTIWEAPIEQVIVVDAVRDALVLAVTVTDSDPT